MNESPHLPNLIHTSRGIRRGVYDDFNHNNLTQ